MQTEQIENRKNHPSVTQKSNYAPWTDVPEIVETILNECKRVSGIDLSEKLWINDVTTYVFITVINSNNLDVGEMMAQYWWVITSMSELSQSRKLKWQSQRFYHYHDCDKRKQRKYAKTSN